MKVLWLTNIPSPYRVDFFNEFGKSCELTVLFEKAAATNRDNSWTSYTAEHFCPIVLRSVPYTADSAASVEVLHYLRRLNYDAVIITNFSSMTGALAVAYLRSKGKPYYLESDGGFPSGGRLKAWLKTTVIRGAKGYFSTSAENDNYFLTYGATSERLVRYPFTSVRESQILGEPPTAMQRANARGQLSIAQPRMVLSIGQFIPRKRLDILIRAFATLQSDVALCIVGGEPPKEYLGLVEALGLSNVYFFGFQRPADLKAYWTAADLFVLPTATDIWGLVVNEALAHALPVITTDRCIAGLELVAPHDCGLIVPVGNVEALSGAISLLLRDDDLRSAMSLRALQVSMSCTIEKMAKRHELILRERSAANVH